MTPPPSFFAATLRTMQFKRRLHEFMAFCCPICKLVFWEIWEGTSLGASFA